MEKKLVVSVLCSWPEESSEKDVNINCAVNTKAWIRRGTAHESAGLKTLKRVGRRTR